MATAKKAATKKVAAKTSAAGKAVTKKIVAKKGVAKKAVAKKAVAKKVVAKTVVANKAAGKKAATKKAATRKVPTSRGRVQDRRLVAGKQKHEVQYEASKEGVAPGIVEQIVQAVGSARKKVEATIGSFVQDHKPAAKKKR